MVNILILKRIIYQPIVYLQTAIFSKAKSCTHVPVFFKDLLINIVDSYNRKTYMDLEVMLIPVKCVKSYIDTLLAIVLLRRIEIQNKKSIGMTCSRLRRDRLRPFGILLQNFIEVDYNFIKADTIKFYPLNSQLKNLSDNFIYKGTPTII